MSPNESVDPEGRGTSPATDNDDPADATTECDTCGDRSDSEPGLPCGRLVGPPGHDDDHPDATPCTGTYQPPPSRVDPQSWRELFTMMTPKMWVRFALLCVPVIVTVVIVVVGVVQSLTGR